MKTRLAAAAAGCFIFVLFITSGVYTTTSGAQQSSLDEFTIDNKGYKMKRKGPVPFNHRKHALDYRISCWECHHEYKDGKNVWSPWEQTQQCGECHDPVKAKNKAVTLQKAYHLNCRDCHAKMAAEKKRTGPYRKCYGCHTQESPKK